jgi:acylglycerol lipase
MTSGEGLPAETISRSPEIVKAYVDDPLVFNDNVPPELMAKLIEVIGRFNEAIPKVNVPVLLIHGTADLLTAFEGANLAHAQLIVTDKTLKAYEGLYHEVLNEPERDQVIADVVGWMDEH